LLSVRQEKGKLLLERRAIKERMERQMKQAVKEAVSRGREREKARADRLSSMIQGKTQQIQDLNSKIRELQDQLKRGTTPQVEGLNLEEQLVKELRREFAEDRIEHHGKTGDILHRVQFRRRQVGMILYECKRTSKFSPAFVDQAKRAMASRQATYGVLVTTAFKRDTAGFWVEKDILVVHPYGAVYIAKVLRKMIIDMYSMKASRHEMEARSRELIEFIKGDTFRNSVEDTIYRARSLYETLKKEIKNHQHVWHNRFDNYKEIHDNVMRVSFVTSSILKGATASDALAHMDLKHLPPPQLEAG
jgi:hypothetical protein